jgi:mRNA interferase MazF
MEVAIRKMGNSQGVLIPVIVAPMTTGSRPAAFRVPLTFQGQHGLIVLDQLRALDRARLVKRLGALRAQTLASTLNTLQAMFSA